MNIFRPILGLTMVEHYSVILLGLGLLQTIAMELQTEEIFKEIIESAIFKETGSMSNLMTGILVMDDPPMAQSQLVDNERKWILKIFHDLSIPTIAVQAISTDIIWSETSIGVTVWVVPSWSKDEDLIHAKLHQLEKMTSGIRENTIILIDKHGFTWPMHNAMVKGMTLKRKSNRPIFIYHVNRCLRKSICTAFIKTAWEGQILNAWSD